MHAVKLSRDFMIEIPKELRDRLELHAGQEVWLFVRDGQIRVARRAIEELRGMCPGMKCGPEMDRDHNDRSKRSSYPC
jgi:AbrB family looped-hinge helix DNA binding protein